MRNDATLLMLACHTHMQIIERYRVLISPAGPGAFHRMVEITGFICKHGERHRRGNMGEAKDYLESTESKDLGRILR